MIWYDDNLWEKQFRKFQNKKIVSLTENWIWGAFFSQQIISQSSSCCFNFVFSLIHEKIKVFLKGGGKISPFKKRPTCSFKLSAFYKEGLRTVTEKKLDFWLKVEKNSKICSFWVTYEVKNNFISPSVKFFSIRLKKTMITSNIKIVQISAKLCRIKEKLKRDAR